MRLGTGVWFRVIDGRPVTANDHAAATESSRRRMKFTAVPRVAFLNGDQDLFDRASSGAWSAVGLDELTSSLSFEGCAIGKNEILDAEFIVNSFTDDGRSKLVVHHFPGAACPVASGADGKPVADTWGDRIVPLTEAFLSHLLGSCHFPADALADWNHRIADGISRVKTSCETAMVMNQAQAEWLQSMGILPLAIFEPPPSGWLDSAVDATGQADVPDVPDDASSQSVQPQQSVNERSPERSPVTAMSILVVLLAMAMGIFLNLPSSSTELD